MNILNSFWHSIGFGISALLITAAHLIAPTSPQVVPQKVQEPAAVATSTIEVPTAHASIKKTQPILIEKTQTVTPTKIISAPASWTDLETQYFAEATQKGWASLVITNSAGEKRYYRLENGRWIQKDTLAEAQQVYQPPLPPATADQIAGIALLCSVATTQGNTQVIQYCTDGSILKGYNTNAIFRKNIDALVEVVRQKIAQQQTAAENQAYVQNWISGLNAASQVSQNFASLQNSINAENAALQAQQQNAQILQTVQQNQRMLEQLATPKPSTHCGIDAGVFSCSIPGAF